MPADIFAVNASVEEREATLPPRGIIIPFHILVDGNFTDWSFWSLCSVTCGDGVRQRTRSCTHPPPSFGGADCTGKILEVKDCYRNKSCPGTQSIEEIYLDKTTLSVMTSNGPA